MLLTLTFRVALNVLLLKKNEKVDICDNSESLSPCFASPVHIDIEKPGDTWTPKRSPDWRPLPPPPEAAGPCPLLPAFLRA